MQAKSTNHQSGDEEVIVPVQTNSPLAFALPIATVVTTGCGSGSVFLQELSPIAKEKSTVKIKSKLRFIELKFVFWLKND